jgi:hypothetical protein
MPAKLRLRYDLLLLLSLLLVIVLTPVLDHGDWRRLVLGAILFLPVILSTVRLADKSVDVASGAIDAKRACLCSSEQYFRQSLPSTVVCPAVWTWLLVVRPPSLPLSVDLHSAGIIATTVQLLLLHGHRSVHAVWSRGHHILGGEGHDVFLEIIIFGEQLEQAGSRRHRCRRGLEFFGHPKAEAIAAHYLLR